MTAGEVLDLAGTFLQEPKVSGRTTGDPELLRMVNSVVSEICGEYFPLRKTEEAESGGEIPLSSLSERLRQVADIKKEGRRVGFRLLPFCIRTEAGRVEVDYFYLPAAAEDEQSELELSPLLDARAVALGVAAEYCLCSGLYEQALAFDRRFRDSLAALAPHRERRLPERRFP